MKFSVITVTFNSSNFIQKCISSVNSQKYLDIEHIIVDGKSSDNTIELIHRQPNRVTELLSEPDNGVYDAMNKGFYLATGDVVSFLNSDDVYYNDSVISEVENIFRNNNVDFVYGNLEVRNPSGEVLRFWKCHHLNERGLVGTQIPHPCLFVRRSVLDRIKPPFDSNLKISADIKQQLIFINKFGYKGYYLDRTLAIMSNGGASTNSLKSYILGWKETMDSYNEIFGSGGLIFTIKKILSKFRGVKNFSLITKR